MMKNNRTEINIGINAEDRQKVARGLSVFLADSYTLYLMTHNFHWNVTGPQFNSLHNMFMTQYTEQWNALDMIALPEGEGTRCAGRRRRQRFFQEWQGGGDRRHRPVVLGKRAPAGEHHAPTVFNAFVDVRKSLHRIGKEHDAEAGHHEVRR